MPAETKPLTNNAMSHMLRSASSALAHGRLNTAWKKVEPVYLALAPLAPVAVADPKPLFCKPIDNAARSNYGALAVAIGNPDHDKEPIEASISDTLANIMHFCRREGIDFQQRLVTAEIGFEGEACNDPTCPNDTDDGEGYDGFCGSCADKKEAVNAQM
jgi:hypothetical protein